MSSSHSHDYTYQKIGLKTANEKDKKQKKRGAPFKGNVSDQIEEKNKHQRQKVLRDFKSYYEKRVFLERLNKNQPKKKRNFNDN